MYQRPVSSPSTERQPAEPPADINRAIFRSEALDHYIQNQQKVELPRLISVKLFRYLWLVALLSMAAGALIVFWPLITQFALR